MNHDYNCPELSDKEKEALYLKEEMGMTNRQIANRQGVHVRTVEKRISKARKKLQFAESNGVLQTAKRMGVDTSILRHGWLKTDEGSFFFGLDKDQLAFQPDEFADIIKEVFENEIERPKSIGPRIHTNDDLLTKYVLADMHIGMFAWAEESGEDYDLEIAEETLLNSIDMIIESTPNSETAVLLNLGDFFHSNDAKGITPLSGHILDMDTRFAKIASVGIKAIRYALEKMAEKHKYVEYVSVPGNHDPDQSVWLTLALIEAYRDHPQIKVHWNPGFFFVKQHGMNMLAAHHGDRTNFQRLALYMADRYPEIWGQTYWRFLDTGHIHHQREQEIGGVLVRSYRTLAAKDAYASKGAYSARRSMTAQTYHKTRGEILTNNIHLFNGKV